MCRSSGPPRRTAPEPRVPGRAETPAPPNPNRAAGAPEAPTRAPSPSLGGLRGWADAQTPASVPFQSLGSSFLPSKGISPEEGARRRTAQPSVASEVRRGPRGGGGSGGGRELQQVGKGGQSGCRSHGQGRELQPRPRRPPPDDATCRTAPAGGDAPWQCGGKGSRPGRGTGFLFDWEDLPNLKGVQEGGGLAPRRVLKQLVRFRPF